MNLFIGMVNDSVSLGTYGRAEPSNMPTTERGRLEPFSR
jgi:hypothetical protein